MKGYDLMNHLMPRGRRDFFNHPRDFFDTAFDSLMNEDQTFSTDIVEKEDAYELTADMPGIDKGDISIDYTDDILSIQADHTQSADMEDDEGRYIRRERSKQSYQRAFMISDIKADEISAQFENGVLSINLPKKEKEEQSSHQIEID